MKNAVRFLMLFGALATLGVSCDKVEYPNIPVEGLDTTLYPGLFSEYTAPTFSENTNTLRNLLIEDFTGHQCGGCPGAAIIASNLEDANPGRVFVASIHAGPSNNGITGFQVVQNPDYPRDFTNPQGLEMASTFFQLGIGFVSNPRGAVSRIADESGTFMYSQGNWSDIVAANLASPLNVNLQAKSNYYSETNGVFLHVESHFINALEGDYNIVVYAIENDVVSPQLIGSERDPDYHHHNVHRGNLFDETWGRSIASGQIAAGTKTVTNLSYQLPDGLTNEDMHFQILVYDRESYEIMQVIEHHF